MKKMNSSIAVVILGATGAVGSQALNYLLEIPNVNRITTLGRRPVSDIKEDYVIQEKVDIFKPKTYDGLLNNHQVAICTLGVGEPSKMAKEDFVKIDKNAVLDFAKASKKAGILHFQLLSSVGINANSRSFFLRTKGELVEELKKLHFERLSIFQPSMILTPENRYGISQAIVLKTWPILNPILLGSLKKYRGIRVEQLGKSMALNILSNKQGLEMLTWNEFQEITKVKVL